MEQTDTNRTEVQTNVYKPPADDYNSMRLRLDPTPILEQLRHGLKREFYDEKTDSWANPHNLKPMLSDAGVEDLMIDLTSRMSVDKVLGYNKDGEYNIILREIGEAILGFLFFNTMNYEIQEADMDRIFHIVMHSVRLFLSRARCGLEN